MRFAREWSMPSGDTFSMKPVAAFLGRWIEPHHVVVDPFARDSKWGTITNDLSPDASSKFHMDAEDFCRKMFGDGVRADVVLFDPPYSPRQISELYHSIGKEVGMKGTQNAALYKRVRDAAHELLKPSGVVLSFGWNSNGMGKGRGYEIEEILMVAHGGGHNDTICLAERLTPRLI